MEGGVKQLDKTLTSFDAVKAMIQDSTLTHIAYSSLSGFIFRIDSPNVSSFLALNESGTQFSRPVHSLVLKLALVVESNQLKTGIRLPRLKIQNNHYEKAIEVLHEFSRESEIQQKIYEKTISPAGKPICLSVVDFSHFNEKESSLAFVKLLSSKTTDPIALEMLKYLETYVSKDIHVAMIAMQLAENYSTLNSIKRHNPSAYDTTCLRSLAQIIILFVKMKYVNFDCHSGNILANDRDSYLIDFGRVLDLNTFDDAEFKETYNILADLCGTISYDDDWKDMKGIDITDLYVNKERDTPHVIGLLHDLLVFITRVDQAFNYLEFKIIYPQNFSLFEFIYDGTNHSYARLAKLIPIIRELTEAPSKAVNPLSTKAIDSMKKTGRMFSLEHDLALHNRKLSSVGKSQQQRTKRKWSTPRSSPPPKTPSRRRSSRRKSLDDWAFAPVQSWDRL